jgi:hypothetical protein
MRPLSLEGGLPLAWIDRVLPTRPLLFLLVVGGISITCWVLGYLLAADKQYFLAVREWKAQLIYLPVHFITLRLFVTLYTRNFIAGIRHMDIPPPVAFRRMHLVLGPLGLASLLLAAPLCWWDFNELDGDKYHDQLVGPVVEPAEPATTNTSPDTPGQGDVLPFGGKRHPAPPIPEDTLAGDKKTPAADHRVGAADLLMWGIWCVEWIINAYIWVLLLGFLAITMETLRGYRFRDPVEVVLHEKQFRPFLMMSGQGASIVLGFGLANAAYVWYADGTITDYIGLGVTIVLLLVGFGPPWLQIKSSVERVVNAEVFRLREALIAAHKRGAMPLAANEATAADSTQRLDEALMMLRIDYLDRLHRELGRNEGAILLLKLLAPASGILFKLLRPFLIGF